MYQKIRTARMYHPNRQNVPPKSKYQPPKCTTPTAKMYHPNRQNVPQMIIKVIIKDD